MKIRQATLDDFVELYSIGKNAPELKVSKDNDFMEPDEFKSCIQNKNGVLLLAEDNKKIAGFIYANSSDIEMNHSSKWACIVYIVVSPEYRKQGVASMLYGKCARKLKEMGVSNVYGWANPNSGILPFLESKGFDKGGTYIWMDKKIR